MLKLMFGSMTRAAERSIRFTEFERRQIDAVRQELDAEYEADDTISPAARQARPVTGLSSSSRT